MRKFAIPPKIGWYIAGFVDGEGSFIVSVRKKKDYQLGWQIDLVFNVAQRDISNLVLLKKFLGCGRLQRRKDGVNYFIVNNYASINERVIPFFSSKKKKNFLVFTKIAKIYEEKLHLTKDGLKEIMFLREKLNEGAGRTRKYKYSDIIN